MSPTIVPTSTTGLTSTATVTKAPTKVTKAPTTTLTAGTKEGLSGEPSPSYKRKILDVSKFSVSLHYLLHVV